MYGRGMICCGARHNTPENKPSEIRKKGRKEREGKSGICKIEWRTQL
jgi:hypothetical protein